MEETKYYVFDCDTDLYKLSQKINNIFKEFQRKNSRNKGRYKCSKRVS